MTNTTSKTAENIPAIAQCEMCKAFVTTEKPNDSYFGKDGTFYVNCSYCIAVGCVPRLKLNLGEISQMTGIITDQIFLKPLLDDEISYNSCLIQMGWTSTWQLRQFYDLMKDAIQS